MCFVGFLPCPLILRKKKKAKKREREKEKEKRGKSGEKKGQEKPIKKGFHLKAPAANGSAREAGPAGEAAADWSECEIGRNGSQ